MHHARSGIIAAALFAWLLAAGPAAAEVVDRIVGQVNDEIITMSELETASKSVESELGVHPKAKENQAFQRQMLEGLIDRKLANAEAKRRGITIPDKEVDQSLESFKKRNGLTDEAAFTKALNKSGLTLKELRQQITDQLMQERLLQQIMGGKIKINEADVHRAYEEHFKAGGNQVHLKVMKLPYPPGVSDAQKVEYRKKAEAILKDLSEGAGFAAVAQKHSVEQTDMGFMNAADLDPKLNAILKELKPGGLVPVETPQGFQLIQMTERRTAQAHSFEEVAPQIRQVLMQKEMEKYFSEWIKTLRDKATIKIML